MLAICVKWCILEIENRVYRVFRKESIMVNILELVKNCKDLTGKGGCAACPFDCKAMCDELNDLATQLSLTYTQSGSCPADWTEQQTRRIHKMMTRFLFYMEPDVGKIAEDFGLSRREI